LLNNNGNISNERNVSIVYMDVARGDKVVMPPKFLEIVILCFERRFSKQNSAIRLTANILAPTNFWAGYATDRVSPGYQRYSWTPARFGCLWTLAQTSEKTSEASCFPDLQLIK